MSLQPLRPTFAFASLVDVIVVAVVVVADSMRSLLKLVVAVVRVAALQLRPDLGQLVDQGGHPFVVFSQLWLILFFFHGFVSMKVHQLQMVPDVSLLCLW